MLSSLTEIIKYRAVHFWPKVLRKSHLNKLLYYYNILIFLYQQLQGILHESLSNFKGRLFYQVFHAFT